MSYHKLHIVLIALLFNVFLYGQQDTTQHLDSLDIEPQVDLSFVDYYDSMLVAHFEELSSFTTDTNFLNTLNHPEGYKPAPADSVFEARLALLDEQSPFEFKYSPATLAMIKLYAYKRHRLTARMLGLGELYFPLFEEKLIAHNMPLELKYLPIVESALKPHARSHMGAGGLWQFMPATGRSYGLEITSLIDERSDPYMATEAACEYLSKMYEIYGDWSMSLAAYNCGPGNVNKAIRRSGGKTDFWGIREFLPRETRNYVPAFIAVNYIMNYASEHNIYPKVPEFLAYEMDTVHVCTRVEFGVLEEWTGYNRAQFAYLNPMFITEVMPKSPEQFYTLKMPVKYIGKFLEFEDSIYKYSSLENKYLVAANKPARVQKYHYIQTGETLATIAKKYECTEQDIKAWNTRTKIRMKKGRKILVFEPTAKKVSTRQKTELIADKSSNSSNGEYFYYTIRKGDTLWDISQKYKHTNLNEIKSLNSHLNFKNLKTGTKIKIAKY